MTAGACLDTAADRSPQPVDPALVGLAARDHVRVAADDLRAAAAWLEDDALATRLADAVGAAVSGEDAGAPLDPTDSALEAALGDLADLTDRVADELLAPGHLAEQDATSATFRLSPDALCPSTAADGHDRCVARFTAAPLFVRATSLAAGDLDLALSVGAGDGALSVATLALHADAVRLTVHVADAAEALARMDLRLPGDDRAPLTVRAARGTLSLTLVRRGPRAARATLDVPAGLTVDGAIGGHGFVASLEPSRVSVDLDGDARRALVDVALGALAASAPLGLVADLARADGEPRRDVPGALALDLPGLGAHLAATGEGGLDVTGLTLGPRRATLALDGAPVVGLDLDAGVGRAVDLTLRDDPAGPIASVTRELTLIVAIDLARLAALDADLARGWSASDVLGLAIDEAPAPTFRLLDGADDGAGPIAPTFAPLAGRIAVVSRARPDLSREVHPGACLTLAPPDDTAPHPLERLVVAPCDSPPAAE